MSSTSENSSSKFNALFDEALAEYKKQTGKDLRDHPLASDIDNCDTADSLLVIFQKQAKEFKEFRDGDPKLMKWLQPVVNGLYSLSSSTAVTIVVGLAFPPANPILSAISVLLSTGKSVKSSYDALIDIFEYIDNFLRRLMIYSEIKPTLAMTEVIIKIMVELLSVLALATTQISQGKLKKYMGKLLGEKKIEAVLQRLDRLTLHESQQTVAQTLEVVCGLVDNMKVVMKDGEASTDGIRQALVQMQKVAVQISRMERIQLQQELRRWLSAPNPSIKHNNVRKAYYPGTAEWFTGGKVFGEWKLMGTLLWVHGRPGSGKTILCSTIIENIQLECETGLAVLIFYYFDFRNADEQDVRKLLSSLLFQLGDQSDKFSQVLSALHSSHSHGSRQPSEAELLGCLKSMLELLGQGELYIVVDALDECYNVSGYPSPPRQEVPKIIKELLDLNLSHVHLCITSRFERDILLALHPLEPVSVSLHDQDGQKADITQYVKAFVDSDAVMREWPNENREEVINTLAEKGSGMFRWAQCQLETLRHCPLQDISHTLKRLPKDLNETYERILQGIPDQKGKYSHRIFQCLTISFRQLRVDELAEVFVIDMDTEPTRIPKFNSHCRERNAEGAVQSACPSLVAVVDIGGDQIAQFSHFSVQEFLVSQSLERSQDQHLSKYHVYPQSAHAFFATACLCVLLHLGNDVDEAKIKKFPLASYAAKYWVDHAKPGRVSSDIQARLMMEVLFDKALPHFKTWVWLYNVDTRSPGSTPHPREPDAVPLYYAALCGFLDIAKHLVRAHPNDVDAPGGNHVTPLHAALIMEHLDIALLLLENGADVESRGIEGQTPLHIASDRGYTGIVKSLIDDHGAKKNAENAGRESPLTLASKGGRAEVVGVLLARGADPNHQDRGGWTPLHNASQKGHHDVVRLLLGPVQAPIANLNAQDLNHNTPLHIASFHGKTAVVTILLERGATLDARDKQGGTALHDAAQGGHLEVVHLLLKRSADSRARNRIGEMPFQVASRNNHTDVAQLLREHAGE